MNDVDESEILDYWLLTEHLKELGVGATRLDPWHAFNLRATTGFLPETPDSVEVEFRPGGIRIEETYGWSDEDGDYVSDWFATTELTVHPVSRCCTSALTTALHETKQEDY